jgi:pimeloyl-ACP methyl ester carboxylesterase
MKMTAVTHHSSLQHDKSTNVRANNSAPIWLRSGFAGASRIAPGLTSALAARLFRTTRRSSPRPGEREVLTDAQGSRIAGMQVWSWGEGPIVLLVHGWNGRSTQLGSLISPLVARGYRVVAFDALGHGDSDGTQSSLPEFANCIRQVADELGEIYAIVAHSLGGAATMFALAYGLKAERAVFISPPADPREFLKVFGAALGINDDVRARVKHRLERRLGVPMEEMLAQAIAPRMQIPLMVIHDRDDKEVPFSVGRSIACQWPDAELTVTEGLGHQRILGDPSVTDAAVRFVDADMHLQNAA